VGPDIAIVELDDQTSATLQATKAFYHFNPSAPVSDDPRASTRWAITGASAELSKFAPTAAVLKNHTLSVTDPVIV
jgi:hypothetical protein